MAQPVFLSEYEQTQLTDATENSTYAAATAGKGK